MPDIDELSLGARLSELTALFAAASPVELAEAISRQCREAQGMNSTSLAYGELCMTDTTALVERIATKHMGFRDGGTLVDIGSGAGLALLAASLPHRFDRAYGIEILSGLHRKAEENLAQWQSQSANEGSTSNISFVEGDITEIDWWSDRNLALVIIHATVFDGDLFSSVQLRAEECPVGCWFLCVTKELRTGPRTNMVTVERVRCRASWGEATIAIQRRVDFHSNME